MNLIEEPATNCEASPPAGKGLCLSAGDCGQGTPLIRLNRLSELTGCEILGKAEFLNPGGSVKYRTAVGIIDDAEAKGRLQPGDTIVEGSAGNTGIGLTVVGRDRGYRTVIVVCETTSPEKIQLLRKLGAAVIPVPERPPGHPENYNRVAQRLAAEHGWLWANQFDNTANRLAHYHATGPEIWEQTRGEVTGFVSAVGTGGTLAGTGSFLKERNPGLLLACADTCAGAMWSWFARGKVEAGEGDSIAEGIGQTRLTGNLAGVAVDRAYRIDDQTALTIVHHLQREEALSVGFSSGINLAGAVRLALEGGPGQTIVTILCDSGRNYQSRLFNNEWLWAHGLDSHLPIESVPGLGGHGGNRIVHANVSQLQSGHGALSSAGNHSHG
jgi:cysteine synthase